MGGWLSLGFSSDTAIIEAAMLPKTNGVSRSKASLCSWLPDCKRNSHKYGNMGQ
jgi:hypothetical protein